MENKIITSSIQKLLDFLNSAALEEVEKEVTAALESYFAGRTFLMYANPIFRIGIDQRQSKHLVLEYFFSFLSRLSSGETLAEGLWYHRQHSNITHLAQNLKNEACKWSVKSIRLQADSNKQKIIEQIQHYGFVLGDYDGIITYANHQKFNKRFKNLKHLLIPNNQ